MHRRGNMGRSRDKQLCLGVHWTGAHPPTSDNSLFHDCRVWPCLPKMRSKFTWPGKFLLACSKALQRWNALQSSSRVEAAKCGSPGEVGHATRMQSILYCSQKGHGGPTVHCTLKRLIATEYVHKPSRDHLQQQCRFDAIHAKSARWLHWPTWGQTLDWKSHLHRAALNFRKRTLRTALFSILPHLQRRVRCYLSASSLQWLRFSRWRSSSFRACTDSEWQKTRRHGTSLVRYVDTVTPAGARRGGALELLNDEPRVLKPPCTKSTMYQIRL